MIELNAECTITGEQMECRSTPCMKSSMMYRMRRRWLTTTAPDAKSSLTALIGTLRDRHQRPSAQSTLSATTLAHGEPFFPTAPIEFLLVHVDALALKQDV